MFKKKECVAMLLAGGQGSRLYALTEFTAKPAVSFGSKYRIIDFPLSNCINSNIDTVGVLTQYQPLQLNEYIGNGQPWDLDRTFGGVTVLPPYQGKNGADWYKGTANAIYQNLKYIERYDPEYVLILSGDHIYKMDYAKMLQFHKKTGAACTISVLNVPIEEASRFGILSSDENNKIFKFEEKPPKPQSTKASMGIYIFNKDVLFKYLIEDENTEGSSNDFGKNIIPTMLERGEPMYAYEFDGYWKDVGTIKSLWEANMDLLGKNPEFDIDDDNWRFRSRNAAAAPQFIGNDAVVENSIITEGCVINGTVINSVLSANVTVEAGAVVKDSVIMQGTTVKKNASVLYSIIDEEATVGEGAVVGNDRENAKEVTVLGMGADLPAGAKVEEGKILSAEDVKGGNK
ncbi:MAG: glucose-1-phosphate adenylyltransferase [Ruminococcaceae bacterium]|nr:glucose-1-phosphate adenylyltransferase [Oscillospiraceae bacterium]